MNVADLIDWLSDKPKTAEVKFGPGMINVHDDEGVSRRKIINKKQKLMFDKFEEYAAIMKITKAHPYWDAFKIVWNMARTPAMITDKKGKLKIKD